MFNRRTIATGAVAVSAFALSMAPSFGDTLSGFYLAVSPGISVEYLSLIDTGPAVTGYMEAIRAAPTSVEGQTRVQTFSRGGAGILSFGSSTAIRTSNGYTVTSMTPQGQLVQQRFVRSDARAVNAAILALSVSVSRNRVKSQLDAARADARALNVTSSDDVARLTKAQLAVDAASAQLTDAQRTADRLSLLSRQARADANAAIDKPGVSLAQNQGRITAMKTADDAEQNVIIAQRTAAAAATSLAAARAEVARLRLRIADGTRSPAAGPSNDIGP